MANIWLGFRSVTELTVSRMNLLIWYRSLLRWSLGQDNVWWMTRCGSPARNVTKTAAPSARSSVPKIRIFSRYWLPENFSRIIPWMRLIWSGYFSCIWYRILRWYHGLNSSIFSDRSSNCCHILKMTLAITNQQSRKLVKNIPTFLLQSRLRLRWSN